jgi:hypothetical protein
MPNSVNGAPASLPHPLSKQFHDDRQALATASTPTPTRAPSTLSASAALLPTTQNPHLLDIPADIWVKNIAPRLGLGDFLALQQTSRISHKLMETCKGSFEAKFLDSLQSTLLKGFETDRLMPAFWDESNAEQVAFNVREMCRTKKQSDLNVGADVPVSEEELQALLPKTVSLAGLRQMMEKAISVPTLKLISI